MYPILGYACISQLYPQFKTGSTSTLTYINKLREEQRGPYLRAKAKQNVANLLKLLEKNSEGFLRAYRLPDDFMPMADLGYYDIKEFSDDLALIGDYANKQDMFLSCHPSQFFVLNSATQRVVDACVKNFNIFAQILEMFQLKNKPTLLTHVGARHTYTTRAQACDAFASNFETLSPAAQQFLAVENDQSAHSLDSCLDIHKQIGIPVVIDNAHYAYKPVPDLSLSDAVQLAVKTWKDRTPKVHLSTEREGSVRHAHADLVSIQDFDSLYQPLLKSNIPQAIIMIEAKSKDVAAQLLFRQMLSKYNQQILRAT